LAQALAKCANSVSCCRAHSFVVSDSMVYFSVAKALGFHLLALYPFFFIDEQFETLNPQLFQLCTEIRPCTFTRFFGKGSLPSTRPQHLPGYNASDKRTMVGAGEKYFNIPQVFRIECGHVIKYASYWQPLFPFFSFMIQVWTSVPLVPLSLINYLTEDQDTIFLDPSFHTQDKDVANATAHCESSGMRQRIINHLAGRNAEGYSRLSLRVGLCLLCLVYTIHDWLLLAGVSESYTLTVSWVTNELRLLVALAAFSWAVGATEVFVAPDPAVKNFGCYYQLPDHIMLLVFATPCYLYVKFHFAVSRYIAAVQHGDHLFYASYDVPYRVAKASVPQAPDVSLLVGAIQVDDVDGTRSSMQGNVAQELSFRDFAWLADDSRPLFSLCRSIMHISVLALVLGPLGAQTFALATRMANFWSFEGVARVVVLVVAVCSPWILPYIVFILCYRLQAARRSDVQVNWDVQDKTEDRYGLAVSILRLLATVVLWLGSMVPLFLLPWIIKSEALPIEAFWAAGAGTCAFCCSCLTVQTLTKDKVVLTLRLLKPTVAWAMVAESLDQHPEWRIKTYTDFYQAGWRDANHLKDELEVVRVSALGASGPHTTVVESALRERLRRMPGSTLSDEEE